ncbi:hypothetical protein PAGU2595_028900 [Lysobacter xanthus]
MEVPDEVLWKCSLPLNIFETVAGLSFDARDEPGGLLDQSACALADRFLDGQVGFWDADGVMTCLMQLADWQGPLRFWRIFLAFEDSETDQDPEKSARARLVVELSGNGS